MVGGICATLAVLSGPEEEEEGDPGEVNASDFTWGGYLGGGVQGLDNINWEGKHSCWRRIFFLIGRQLVYHTRVEFLHAVVVGVVGPHGCEYLTNRAEVLIYQSIPYGFPLRGQKSGTDTLSENLEEKNWVFSAFKVRGDVQPAAEALPLVPYCGMFIEYYRK